MATEEKRILLLAGLAGASGVIAGSLVAHLHHAAEDAALLDTAVRYHMYHALALLGLAALAAQNATAGARSGKWLAVAAWLFVAGIAFFSGGLYIRAGFGHTPLDAIVPIGGLSFITGWLALVTGAFQRGER